MNIILKTKRDWHDLVNSSLYRLRIVSLITGVGACLIFSIIATGQILSLRLWFVTNTYGDHMEEVIIHNNVTVVQLYLSRLFITISIVWSILGVILSVLCLYATIKKNAKYVYPYICFMEMNGAIFVVLTAGALGTLTDKSLTDTINAITLPVIVIGMTCECILLSRIASKLYDRLLFTDESSKISKKPSSPVRNSSHVVKENFEEIARKL